MPRPLIALSRHQWWNLWCSRPFGCWQFQTLPPWICLPQIVQKTMTDQKDWPKGLAKRHGDHGRCVRWMCTDPVAWADCLATWKHMRDQCHQIHQCHHMWNLGQANGTWWELMGPVSIKSTDIYWWYRWLDVYMHYLKTWSSRSTTSKTSK